MCSESTSYHARAIAHVRQALCSLQKLRDVLGTHLFRALCSTHVRNSDYMDAQGTSSIEPTESGWPLEEATHQLLVGMIQGNDIRSSCDRPVLRLLWPRRDLSTLEDLTRLVVIFKTVLAEEGHGNARLYIDLLYRAGAGEVDGSDGPDHTGRMRYRDRLWTASRIADILLTTA